MRCPKCGYNSFDHLDSCKKCGRDLVEFKQKFGIKSLLFPGKLSASEDIAEEILDDAVVAATVATPAATARTADAFVPEQASATAGEGEDFGFDFMGDSAEDDDLSFDELFEEAAEEEDVDETLEGPQAESKADAGDEFELPEADDLDDDFGFETEESNTDGSEGRKDPFDLPESSQDAGAPESFDKTEQNDSAADPFFSDEAKLQHPPLDALEDERLEEMLLAEPVSEVEAVVPFGSETVALQEEAEVIAATTVPVDAEESESFEKADFDVLAAEALGPDVAASVVAADSIEFGAVAAQTEDETAEDGWELSLSPGEIPPVGSRVLAFVYDLTLLLLISVAFIVAAEAATASGSVRLIPSFETFIALSIPYFLMIFVLIFGYFTLFHFLTGQTPGKMLTALRVESLEREPLTIGQAFLRSVGGLIQLVPIGLGFVTVLLYPQRRGLSDRLAGTLVISLKSAAGS